MNVFDHIFSYVNTKANVVADLASRSRFFEQIIRAALFRDHAVVINRTLRKSKLFAIFRRIDNEYLAPRSSFASVPRILEQTPPGDSRGSSEAVAEWGCASA